MFTNDILTADSSFIDIGANLCAFQYYYYPRILARGCRTQPSDTLNNPGAVLPLHRLALDRRGRNGGPAALRLAP